MYNIGFVQDQEIQRKKPDSSDDDEEQYDNNNLSNNSNNLEEYLARLNQGSGSTGLLWRRGFQSLWIEVRRIRKSIS